MKEIFKIENILDSGSRYTIEKCLGAGACGKVYQAVDTQADQKTVAIKVQLHDHYNAAFIQEEFKVLRDVSKHSNLPEFYGIFKNKVDKKTEIWFVMELCEGGPVTDLVNGLTLANRRMKEEHIALIMKEILQAVIYLHDNKVTHRDIKASNILLTRDGEVKLVDFGLSRVFLPNREESITCLGSPSWMAPEVVMAQENNTGYDNRVDVWAIGITALEMANGQPPYENMHPTRALFQIARNPPPVLNNPDHWSAEFKDFIEECLTKNPEYRPYAVEIFEHPFLAEIPESHYYLNQELKVLQEQFSESGKDMRSPETVIYGDIVRKGENIEEDAMLVEDLCTLKELNEESVLEQLYKRAQNGCSYTFVGDILISLNPNDLRDIYTEEHHQLYRFKSRSDNIPHVYSIADSAYQAALHQETTQYILLSGESASGKTTNYLHIVDHLLYLGRNYSVSQERIKNAIKLLHAFVHVSNPTNDYSTRSIFLTEVFFGRSGKNTAASFEIFQIEKWRMFSKDTNQSNFHMLYYFYDGVCEMGEANIYLLRSDRQYNYLRIAPGIKSNGPRDNPKQNVKKYQKILDIFKEFEFANDQIATILNCLAAIIHLGDLKFQETGNNRTEIVDKEQAIRIAQLLRLDDQKLLWAFVNYCVVEEESVFRKNRSVAEAENMRDILASTIYSRIVQYVSNHINLKLSYGKTIFGGKYSVKIIDHYGFESFRENTFSQFMINCTNELYHYHYLQHVFAWEALESTFEGVPYTPIHYYDNKKALDELLGKFSVLKTIDEASKDFKESKLIMDRLQRQQYSFISRVSSSEFSVKHFMGKVTYDSKEMADQNRDFLPPEIISVLRLTNDPIIRTFFSSKLDRIGNLCLPTDENKDGCSTYNENLQKYSQTKKMRTAGMVFKDFHREFLKHLSLTKNASGVHFVRCLRTSLKSTSKSFNKEIVKQQIRALAILETAKARKNGFSHRISFSEFLRRYQFLAFDFDENVDVTKENSRLLLVRLKMEGWAIGKNKVFLKYYNEEYLSRMYETQVKKIIKIQSMIRSYLSKRHTLKTANLIEDTHAETSNETEELSREEAAVIVQKAYRDYYVKKLQDTCAVTKDQDATDIMQKFFDKWKKKTIFQVLLYYRAAKYQELYNLSQQIHLYNQRVINCMHINPDINLQSVDSKALADTWLGSKKVTLLKLPFNVNDIPYFNTSYLCEPSTNSGITDESDEPWDALVMNKPVSSQIATSLCASKEENATINSDNSLIHVPYSRNAESQTYPFASEVESINNSISANNDFEFTKPSTTTNTKVPYVNAIAELKTRGKPSYSTSGDDPPFNFQAMLRKTNYKRDSIKRSHDVSSDIVKKDKMTTSTLDNNVSDNGVPDKSIDNNEKTEATAEHLLLSKTEFMPGVYLEGYVIDI